MAGCRRPPGHFRQTAWDAREKTLGTTGAPTGGHRAPLVQGGLLRRQTDAVKGGGPGVLVGHAPQVPDRSTAEQVTVVSVATQHAAQSRPRRMMVGMSYPADRDAVAPAPWRGGLLLLREDVVQGGAGATPLLTRGLLRGVMGRLGDRSTVGSHVGRGGGGAGGSGGCGGGLWAGETGAAAGCDGVGAQRGAPVSCGGGRADGALSPRGWPGRTAAVRVPSLKATLDRTSVTERKRQAAGTEHNHTQAIPMTQPPERRRSWAWQ